MAREDSREEFQKKKDSTEPRKSEAVTWAQARAQYSSFNFHRELIEGKTTIKASDTLEHQPRSGQYLTHAHSQIARVIAAKDGWFGLVRPHRHGIIY